LEVIGFAGLDDVGLVRHTGPVVQAGPVEVVVDLDLALLGQFELQHVHRQLELGLGVVEVLLVEDVAGDPGRVQSQHDERVVPDAEGSDVVAHLLAVTLQVLVLWDGQKPQTQNNSGERFLLGKTERCPGHSLDSALYWFGCTA